MGVCCRNSALVTTFQPGLVHSTAGRTARLAGINGLPVRFAPNLAHERSCRNDEGPDRNSLARAFVLYSPWDSNPEPADRETEPALSTLSDTSVTWAFVREKFQLVRYVMVYPPRLAPDFAPESLRGHRVVVASLVKASGRADRCEGVHWSAVGPRRAEIMVAASGGEGTYASDSALASTPIAGLGPEIAESVRRQARMQALVLAGVAAPLPAPCGQC